jgi:predicted nucleic acid-binding protein
VSGNRYLLDTSALLALIEDEDGAQRVEEILQEHSFVVIWVSLLEVYYITLQERGAAEAHRRYASIKALPGEIVWTIDEPTVLRAGDLKAAHRLSFADSLIAAYALQQGVIVVHKDPEFDALSSDLLMESLPYKKSPSTD